MSDSSLNKQVASALSNYYFVAGDQFADLGRTLNKLETQQGLDFIALDLYADYKNEKKALLMIRTKLSVLEKKHPNSAWLLKKHNDYLYKKAETLITAN